MRSTGPMREGNIRAELPIVCNILPQRRFSSHPQATIRAQHLTNRRLIAHICCTYCPLTSKNLSDSVRVFRPVCELILSESMRSTGPMREGKIRAELPIVGNILPRAHKIRLAIICATYLPTHQQESFRFCPSISARLHSNP